MKISIHHPFSQKKRGEKFMSQRITRRDIDNTHRVNGIS